MNKVLHNARIIGEKVLAIKPGEKILIVTNPRDDLLQISKALAKVAEERGAAHPDLTGVPKEHILNPYLIQQPKKTPKDFMEEYVYTALSKKPDIFISIPANKLGKDKVGLKKPYKKGGVERDHLMMFLLDSKQIRGFWTPHITLDTWNRAIDIDYDLLRNRVAKLTKLMSNAEKVHVTTEKGTDLTFSLSGRTVLPDDGDICTLGGSGNMPCGEVFVGPKVGSMEGTWVLDGMIPLHTGEILFLKDAPLTIVYSGGYIKSVSGEHAEKLLESIRWGETEAGKHFTGKTTQKQALTKSQKAALSKKAEQYARNARHCGELGIGLNPNAILAGTVLEDEKIIKTCHFAIGMNYEHDAPALIHLDGVTFNPTIEVTKAGKTTRVLDKGVMVV